MKYIILFLFPLSMSAQSIMKSTDTIPHEFIGIELGSVTFRTLGSYSPRIECGTWEAMPEEFTDWIAIDTVSIVMDTARSWVDDQEKLMVSSMDTADYAPCGKGTPTRYRQQRICAINGIIQERFRIIRYKYIPKPKSEFEKVIESFKK